MGVPRKDKGVESYESRPHFFTIIVSPSVQLLKLSLPNKFVRDHGKHLSDIAYLRVPNGADWRVEMTKLKGNVWLNKGWKQFADYYSLAIGYFLVFRYDGNSRFRVLILDTTTLEIDYSTNNLHQSGEFRDCKREPASQRRREIPIDAKYEVEKSAKAFESRNPFFMAHIAKRHLSGNTGPVFPTSHCRIYFTKNDHHKYITLRVNNKIWQIMCRLETLTTFCLALSFGWKMFALDNVLQEGDICIFELIDSATKTYDVKLFRKSEYKGEPNLIDEDIKDNIPIETSGRSGKNKRLATCVPDAVKVKLLKKANAFVNGSPGFIIRMNKSYVFEQRHSVHVPCSHSKKYLKDEGDDGNVIVIYGEGKRSWKMKYCIEESYPRLSLSGWRKFRTDNGLAIGDFCAFKLINRTQKAYKVAIFRVNGK